MRLKKHLIFQNVYKTRPLATDRNDLFKFLVTSQHAIIKKGICSAMKSPPSGKLCPLHSCLKSKNNRRRSSVCLSVCLAVVKKNPTRRAIGVNESVHRPSGVCFRLCCCCCCCLSVRTPSTSGYGYVDLLTSGQRETKIKTARKHRAGLRKTIPSAISQACAPRDGC